MMPHHHNLHQRRLLLRIRYVLSEPGTSEQYRAKHALPHALSLAAPFRSQGLRASGSGYMRLEGVSDDLVEKLRVGGCQT